MAAETIPALMRQAPELAPWLRLYQEVLGVADDPGWAAAAAAMTRRHDLRPDQPFLTGAVIPLSAGLATATLRRLMLVASAQEAENGPPFKAASGAAALDAPMLIQAAINEDTAATAASAVALGVDPPALGTIVQLAALPLLRACHAALAGAVPAQWGQGSCPICGAWPVMAEVRGLDQSRHLRCGRCGADWAMPTLWCPFCGESDHTKLGALIPAEHDRPLRIELCQTCRAYIKTATTLRPWAPADVPLADVASVEWDVIALDNGLARPHQPAVALGARIKALP
jgi:FdhE protein